MKVKKTESAVKPDRFKIGDKKGNNVEVVFFDAVEEIEKENQTIYTYYEYVIETLFRANLKELIEDSFDVWFNFAKDKFIKEKSKEIRDLRNKLLDESDKYLLVDRLNADDLNDISKNKWALYRQNLRDLTKQDNFPFEVEFPTKPE